jgi:hypothetical protein
MEFFLTYLINPEKFNKLEKGANFSFLATAQIRQNFMYIENTCKIAKNTDT